MLNPVREVHPMNDNIKIAVIGSIALVVAVAVYMYFSPYQSCVRYLERNNPQYNAASVCASKLSGGNP
jgi:hypothetical protein